MCNNDFDSAKFVCAPVNVLYVYHLYDLVSKCDDRGINIRNIYTYNNGFIVEFDNFPGDAALHDGIRGAKDGIVETIGMPWDDTVSKHTIEELTEMIAAVRRGESWTKYERREENA